MTVTETDFASLAEDRRASMLKDPATLALDRLEPEHYSRPNHQPTTDFLEAGL